MRVFQYDRAGPGSSLWVEITDDELRVSSEQKKGRSLAFSDITTLRYFATESPQRTDYGLLIAGQGRTLEINYVRLRASRDPMREKGFNRAVSAVLAAIADARPELEVISGRPAPVSWLVFLCFLIPAVGGLAMGLVLLPEPGALNFAIPALLIGAVSCVSAVRARPWKRQERIAAADLADLFAGDAPVSA
jgi:hypothetical protein